MSKGMDVIRERVREVDVDLKAWELRRIACSRYEVVEYRVIWAVAVLSVLGTAWGLFALVRLI